MALVTAYRKSDGAKVQIPEHWLGHKRLGADYTQTAPSRPAGEKKASASTTPAAGDKKE